MELLIIVQIPNNLIRQITTFDKYDRQILFNPVSDLLQTAWILTKYYNYYFTLREIGFSFLYGPFGDTKCVLLEKNYFSAIWILSLASLPHFWYSLSLIIINWVWPFDNSVEFLIFEFYLG